MDRKPAGGAFAQFDVRGIAARTRSPSSRSGAGTGRGAPAPGHGASASAEDHRAPAVARFGPEAPPDAWSASALPRGAPARRHRPHPASALHSVPALSRHPYALLRLTRPLSDARSRLPCSARCWRCIAPDGKTVANARCSGNGPSHVRAASPTAAWPAYRRAGARREAPLPPC